jgi:non-homologous end joining protein Ku
MASKHTLEQAGVRSKKPTAPALRCIHLIYPKTGLRIRVVSQDAETDEELSQHDLVKGIEFENDRDVLLNEDDFEQARIDSSGTLTIGTFVEVGSQTGIVCHATGW